MILIWWNFEKVLKILKFDVSQQKIIFWKPKMCSKASFFFNKKIHEKYDLFHFSRDVFRLVHLIHWCYQNELFKTTPKYLISLSIKSKRIAINSWKIVEVIVLAKLKTDSLIGRYQQKCKLWKRDTIQELNTLFAEIGNKSSVTYYCRNNTKWPRTILLISCDDNKLAYRNYISRNY